ncbi:MAG TPA: hypothetical protein VF747_06355 [Blastocatellia bacterium]|jgi:hypothetical protein
MATQQYLKLKEGYWYEAKDADYRARELFDRHYSRRRYKDGRKPLKFVGPGEYRVLLTAACDALFVWRKFISDDGQQGINCAVFRNEGQILSSTLILEACELAWEKWPNQRLYTYVNPRKIRSTNPGYYFLKAGFVKCGVSKRSKLVILERYPNQYVIPIAAIEAAQGCDFPPQPEGVGSPIAGVG